jgi:large subunit ribosomal protein L15
MLTLNTLKNSSREHKNNKRVGRGLGSKLGKTCGRGQKGAGARAGYKRRWGYEGGQMRMHMKIPIRGFSNVRFAKKLDAVNLMQIENLYSDGEVVNAETLGKHGFISGKTHGIKVLGEGQLTKKVTFDVDALSQSAREKLSHAKVHFSEKRAAKKNAAKSSEKKAAKASEKKAAKAKS